MYFARPINRVIALREGSGAYLLGGTITGDGDDLREKSVPCVGSLVPCQSRTKCGNNIPAVKHHTPM